MRKVFYYLGLLHPPHNTTVDHRWYRKDRSPTRIPADRHVNLTSNSRSGKVSITKVSSSTSTTLHITSRNPFEICREIG